MLKTPLRQKLILIITGIFLFFILLEIGLRLGGFIISAMREHENMPAGKRKGEYRIMCLGESTTVWGGEFSYPAQLEEILNQSRVGVKFKVINRGEFGINTSTILKNLEADLNKYKPDMVIAMLGINDTEDYIFYEEPALPGWVIFLKSFRTYKLVKIIRSGIIVKAKEPGCADPEGKEEVARTRIGSFSPGLPDSLGEQMSLPEDNEEELKKILAIYPKNDNARVALGKLYLKQGKFSLSREAFKSALELNPKNIRAFNSLMNLQQMTDKHRAIQEYVQELNINNKALRYFKPVTSHNYKEIRKILSEKGIKLVSAQYPGRSVLPLKIMFAGEEEGIIFVDNEKIFKDALKKASYKEYFNDMFAGDFGHCTPKGNRMLAENIAGVILKECFPE